MSDFNTEATIKFRVDKSSLRDVRETVDDELGQHVGDAGVSR